MKKKLFVLFVAILSVLAIFVGACESSSKTHTCKCYTSEPGIDRYAGTVDLPAGQSCSSMNVPGYSTTWSYYCE
jgi:hypothetical protein